MIKLTFFLSFNFFTIRFLCVKYNLNFKFKIVKYFFPRVTTWDLIENWNYWWKLEKSSDKMPNKRNFQLSNVKTFFCDYLNFKSFQKLNFRHRLLFSKSFSFELWHRQVAFMEVNEARGKIIPTNILSSNDDKHST